LPNQEGEEPEDVTTKHTDLQSFTLIAVGWFLGMVEILRVLYIKTTFKRLTPQMKNIIGMTFSWCIFFGSDWLLSYHFFTSEQGMTKQVALALVVTLIALAMIFTLEVVQDFKHLDDGIETAIHAIINAIGILIGFAWEKAFDVAVAEITDTVHVLPAPFTKMLLAIILAGMVVPAWYRHILPNIILMEQEEEGEEEGGEEGKDKRPETREQDPLFQPLLCGETRQEEEELRAALERSNEESELKAKLENYYNKISDLEQQAAKAGELEFKNRQLEESIDGISKELGELQKLADMLTN